MNLDIAIDAGRAEAETRFAHYRENGTEPDDIYYQELQRMSSFLHAGSQNVQFNATRLRLKRITRAEAHDDLLDRRSYLIRSLVAFETIAEKLVDYCPPELPDPLTMSAGDVETLKS